MYLTPWQTVCIMLAVALGTQATRWLPFLLFDRENKPQLITYLGRVLPPAMMGLLVVYFLRSTPLTAPRYGLPELIALASITALHLWRGNMLLSIGGSTVLYMLLVQLVFI
jgi:branched-subunit amino acid transport protein AzlD